MPLYEYQCPDCQATVLNGRPGSTIQEVFWKRPVPVGHRIKCGLPGCKKWMRRIISSAIAIHIKGQVSHDLKPNECLRTQINGKEVAFQFIDHDHTSPELQRNLGKLAAASGVRQNNALQHAQIDEKTGKLCVKVVSNVPDPLGTISRSIEATGSRTTKKVNTAVKRRGK